MQFTTFAEVDELVRVRNRHGNRAMIDLALDGEFGEIAKMAADDLIMTAIEFEDWARYDRATIDEHIFNGIVSELRDSIRDNA